MRLVRLIGVWFAMCLLAMVGMLGVLREKPSTAGWIAFSSNRGGTTNIYIMRPDGSGVEQLTFYVNNSQELFDPLPLDWSPNGECLVFILNQGEIRNIYFVSPFHRQI